MWASRSCRGVIVINQVPLVCINTSLTLNVSVRLKMAKLPQRTYPKLLLTNHVDFKRWTCSIYLWEKFSGQGYGYTKWVSLLKHFSNIKMKLDMTLYWNYCPEYVQAWWYYMCLATWFDSKNGCSCWWQNLKEICTWSKNSGCFSVHTGYK